MTTKVTVTTKICVDGKAYPSADAMPPDIRQVYDRALEWIDGGTYRGPLSIFTGGFKGNGYSSDHADLRVSNLPTDAQAVSGIVVNGQESTPQTHEGTRSIASSSVPMTAPRPESTTARLVIAGVVVAAMLTAAFVFGW